MDASKITYNCFFSKNGVVVFQGTQFAGQTGIMNGMRPTSYSVSMNTQEDWASNSIFSWSRVLTAAWSPSHLVRHVLETQETQAEASSLLETNWVSKSCSFSVTGASTQNTIYERSIFGSMTSVKPIHWFLTNSDNNEVRDSIEKVLTIEDQNTFDKTRLMEIMKEEKTPATAYTSIQDPSKLTAEIIIY